MQEEAVLFKRMQEGDWEAFNFFFECYSEQLYHYALAFVKKKEEAEDIVQNVFIYLWVNRAKIPHTGSVYAYLCRSVKNSCIDYKLHEQVEMRYQKEISMSCVDETDDSDFDELYRRLQIVMEKLPPKCREIFILGCVDGISYKEIAERLDISVNTVKTQVKVAYKKIKDEFGEHQGKLMMTLCCPFFKQERTKAGN